jgi:hypothetical protein
MDASLTKICGIYTSRGTSSFRILPCTRGPSKHTVCFMSQVEKTPYDAAVEVTQRKEVYSYLAMILNALLTVDRSTARSSLIRKRESNTVKVNLATI